MRLVKLRYEEFMGIGDRTNERASRSGSGSSFVHSFFLAFVKV